MDKKLIAFGQLIFLHVAWSILAVSICYADGRPVFDSSFLQDNTEEAVIGKLLWVKRSRISDELASNYPHYSQYLCRVCVLHSVKGNETIEFDMLLLHWADQSFRPANAKENWPFANELLRQVEMLKEGEKLDAALPSRYYLMLLKKHSPGVFEPASGVLHSRHAVFELETGADVMKARPSDTKAACGINE